MRLVVLLPSLLTKTEVRQPEVAEPQCNTTIPRQKLEVFSPHFFIVELIRDVVPISAIEQSASDLLTHTFHDGLSQEIG